MAKSHTQFVCQQCGRITAAFVGKCPKCGEFGTMVEQLVQSTSTSSKQARTRRTGLVSTPVRLKDIQKDSLTRTILPMEEFSRVLGGGIVPGSLVLIGGDPGIGKSTVLLQVSVLVANLSQTVLYISGEESTQQIKMRADRLNLAADDLLLLTETNLETMLDQIEEIKPDVVVIDSIQTTHSSDLTSAAGSVSQIRAGASRFQELAKNTGVTVFLVGHVTKEGTIAGPRVLEHIVDTVLYLEGDLYHRFRLLRSVKNRFGATSEVGVFEMTEKGLEEVPNPSEVFIAERQAGSSGSSIAVTIEGTRPILVEIQALVSITPFSNPRRTANGIDYQRLLLLAAVLSRRVGLRLHDKDIYCNVIGGLQIDEPAADLAVAVAIASSTKDRPVYADMCFVGEVGLSGELRAVSQLNTRLKEAKKLGFKRFVVPKSRGNTGHLDVANNELIECRTLSEVLDIALLKA
ncbi:MAG TPA: DNA repair protein RadA [candidate division Zixibacteria bacterium]|nr:DNA repair protein RadA [candidate division Zixibacteria bacterium]